MSGDEENIFYTTLDFVTSRPKIRDVCQVLSLYEFVTGRKWHDDYYNWYLPNVVERTADDARGQSQSEGKETAQ